MVVIQLKTSVDCVFRAVKGAAETLPQPSSGIFIAAERISVKQALFGSTFSELAG